MTSKVRMVGRVVGTAALAVLLTGCLKISQNLTLSSDDTVDGEITLAVSKQLLELSGQSEEDMLASITEGDSPVPAGVDFDTKAYDDGEFVGQTYSFAGVPLDLFAQEGEMSIVREGDTFVVSGNLDLSGGGSGVDVSDPTTQQLLESFDVQISITFPGSVENANGEIDGNTVTWTPAFGDNLQISAVGSAIGGGGGGGMLLWILVGAGVLVVIALLVVMMGRRGKNVSAGATPAVIGFSPPGEGAAAGGAVGGPPAPVQPPATPVPVEMHEAATPPPPSDTAGPETRAEAPAPPAEPNAETQSAPTDVATDGDENSGGGDANSGGGDA